MNKRGAFANFPDWQPHVEQNSWGRRSSWSPLCWALVTEWWRWPNGADEPLNTALLLFFCVIVAVIENLWDPLSAKQTKLLSQIIQHLVCDYPTIHADNKNTQVFLHVVSGFFFLNLILASFGLFTWLHTDLTRSTNAICQTRATSKVWSGRKHFVWSHTQSVFLFWSSITCSRCK